jgi:hypothetical protein
MIISLILIGINLTLGAMTNTNLIKLVGELNNKNSSIFADVNKCTPKEKIMNLDKAYDLRLRKLYEYQEVCNSFVVDRLMIFTTMPNSSISAHHMADDMANTLKEFNKYGVKPIVIIEPENAWGLVDFKEFNSGFYDDWIKDYFKDLKQQGITSEQMGMWVPFPEANIPTWNKDGATPAIFSDIVNKYAEILKSVYPNTKVSILLNSATYDNTDYDWEYGEYVSLLPYIKGIKPGLVDSFGLQGFPWIPTNGSTSQSLVDPSQYLNYKLAVEAAKSLNVHNIWINTGTFSEKYTGDKNKTAGLTYIQRKQILDETIDAVKELQSSGFNVSVNLFSENKSDTSEQTNWSYWSDYKNKNNLNATVFKDFVNKAYENNISLSLYDSYHIPNEH